MATQTRNITIVTQQDIQPGREGETEIVISYAGKEYPTGIKAATPEEAVGKFVGALGAGFDVFNTQRAAGLPAPKAKK